MSEANLKDVYKSLKRMNTDEIVEKIRVNMDETLPLLDKYDDDMIIMFAGYIFTITGVDEKIHWKEYSLIKPLMDAAFGINCSFEDTKKFILDYGYDEDEMRDRFRDVLEQLEETDPELRYRMILLAMYISAIDDEISKTEKKYIKSLL